MTLLIPGGKVSAFRHIATTIARDRWEIMHHYAGHVQSVCVTKFSPIFYKTGEAPMFFFALGANDGAISVFDCHSQRLVLALTDVFKSGVTDISWTADGTLLFATSSDGSLITIHWPPEHLGEQYQRSEVENLFR
jgi:WD40 repeat protein